MEIASSDSIYISIFLSFTTTISAKSSAFSPTAFVSYLSWPESLTISLFANIYPSLVCRVSPIVYGLLMDSGAALLGNRIVKTPD